MVDTDGVRPGPRRTLSEEAILDAALSLLAESGADRVTIRGIAARVGVAPNGVYTYFPDKAAVLHGVVESILGGVNHDRFVDPSLPWRDRIEALALELRGELLAHPGSVHLLLADPMTGANSRAVTDTVLSILADAGLPPEDAMLASHLISVHVLGSVALEVADPRMSDAEDRAARYLWGLTRVLDGLSTHGGAR